MEPTESVSIAGVKRPLEEPSAPPHDAAFADALPTASDSATTAAADPAALIGDAAPEGAVPEDAMQAAAQAASVAAPSMPMSAEDAEEASLRREAEYLKQHNGQLQTQLAQLQQQHQALTAAAAAAMQQQQQRPAPAPSTPSVVHNQAWTEQKNPENGITYYWNKDTGESTYTRPHDFNPGAASAAINLPNTKGPAGANLFVVRRMRAGEYDEFNDADLVREFSKYGQVTRAQMTINRENGWSKGFGFVSYGTVEEADAAIQVWRRRLALVPTLAPSLPCFLAPTIALTIALTSPSPRL